ncbi:hypothetical protein ACT4US_15895 [Bacillus sp. HC-Mk]
MAMPLSLLIGLRFSRGRRRGGMVSLISVISTIGIALGVAVLIVGLSAMNGFERELNNRILAVVPHGEIDIRRGSGNTRHFLHVIQCFLPVSPRLIHRLDFTMRHHRQNTVVQFAFKAVHRA